MNLLAMLLAKWEASEAADDYAWAQLQAGEITQAQYAAIADIARTDAYANSAASGIVSQPAPEMRFETSGRVYGKADK